MPINPTDYRNITDAIAELSKRENDLLQRASQAEAGSEKRKNLIGQLAETNRALHDLEGQRRKIIQGA